jgi:hypothetical protein
VCLVVLLVAVLVLVPLAVVILLGLLAERLGLLLELVEGVASLERVDRELSRTHLVVSSGPYEQEA